MTCYKCNAKNQFANVCRSGSGNRSTSCSRDFKKSHVKGNGKGKSQKKKVSEILEDYNYDYVSDSEEESYEIGKIKISTICSCFQSHREQRLNSASAFKCNIVFDEMTSKSHTKVYKDLLVCTKNDTNPQWICMKTDTEAESNILPLREFRKIFPDTSMVELSKMVRPNTILEKAKGDKIKQVGCCIINICFPDNRILCHFF